MILLFFITFSLFYPFLEAKAATKVYEYTRGFGGKITKIQACSVPPGFVIHVGPPTPGKFFLNPATSSIHPYGVIMPGVWVLGNAAPTPMTCSEGNPKGIGGFGALGGLAGSTGSLFSASTRLNEFDEISGITISGPLGGLRLEGQLGETLGGISNSLGGISDSIGNITSSLGNIGSAFSIVGSLMSGDFVGAALSVITFFDPTGLTSLAKLFVSFLDDPPSLGSAYPIIHIGTSLYPAR